MSDKPLEVLPWGRTRDDQAKLDRTKVKGKRGLQGCLLYALAFAFWLVFQWGLMLGRH